MVMPTKLRHLKKVTRENRNNDYKTNRHKPVPRDAMDLSQHLKIVVLFFQNQRKFYFCELVNKLNITPNSGLVTVHLLTSIQVSCYLAFRVLT